VQAGVVNPGRAKAGRQEDGRTVKEEEPALNLTWKKRQQEQEQEEQNTRHTLFEVLLTQRSAARSRMDRRSTSLVLSLNLL